MTADNVRDFPVHAKHVAHRSRQEAAERKQRLAEREIRLDISDAALDLIGEAGFDPVYGARPLKRAIRGQWENPLAQEILAGHFGPGDTVEVDVRDVQLGFGAIVERGAGGLNEGANTAASGRLG